MKYFAITSATLLLMSISSPSLACDMHMGGYNQLGFSNWTPYKEYNTQTEISATEEAEEALKKAKLAQGVKVKKPSFSSVSVRASGAAQARLAAKANLSKIEAKKLTDENISETIKKSAL